MLAVDLPLQRLGRALPGHDAIQALAEILAAAKAVPLERLLLETDAPFLTPKPLRGKINEPKNVSITAEFLAQLRGEELSTLAAATTKNARQLFGLPKHES